MTKHNNLAPLFTPHLHTDEHLEWVAQPTHYQPTDEGASRWLYFNLPLPMILALFGGFSLFALGIAFEVFIESDRLALFRDGISFPVMALCGVVLLVALIVLWYLPGEMRDQRRAELHDTYYAVSDERVLIATNSTIDAVPRGKIDHLEIMPEYGDYATVYFVARDKRTLCQFAHLDSATRTELTTLFEALESVELRG